MRPRQMCKMHVKHYSMLSQGLWILRCMRGGCCYQKHNFSYYELHAQGHQNVKYEGQAPPLHLYFCTFRVRAVARFNEITKNHRKAQKRPKRRPRRSQGKQKLANVVSNGSVGTSNGPVWTRTESGPGAHGTHMAPAWAPSAPPWTSMHHFLQKFLRINILCRGILCINLCA